MYSPELNVFIGAKMGGSRIASSSIIRSNDASSRRANAFRPGRRPASGGMITSGGFVQRHKVFATPISTPKKPKKENQEAAKLRIVLPVRRIPGNADLLIGI